MVRDGGVRTLALARDHRAAHPRAQVARQMQVDEELLVGRFRLVRVLDVAHKHGSRPSFGGGTIHPYWGVCR